jgi:SPP1 family predicted phage head-tail adaptor
MAAQTARLTERLELQELVVTGNSYGEAVETWVTTRVIMASQTTQKGKLSSNSFEQSAMDYISFFCRYTPFLKKGTRVLYKGEAYRVYNVNTVTRNQSTIIELISYL